MASRSPGRATAHMRAHERGHAHAGGPGGERPASGSSAPECEASREDGDGQRAAWGKIAQPI